MRKICWTEQKYNSQQIGLYTVGELACLKKKNLGKKSHETVPLLQTVRKRLAVY